ncbi:MAG: 4-hydroxyproline epimerase [Flavobacteriaceae bacterium]
MKKPLEFSCIDGHTAGNPVRIITAPRPELIGENIMQKRLHFLKEYDWIRTGLMFEPRGHDMMSGSFFYPPADPANDVAILFIETSGCLPMCGHGLIGAVTILIEAGLITPKQSGKLRVETPAGLVAVDYQIENKKVLQVRFKNVPAFLALEGIMVEAPDLGPLSIDVSYGGNFYAIVDVQKNYKGIEQYTADQLIRWSRALRVAINAAHSVQHPEDPNIKGCSHVLWTAAAPLDPKATARNAVFYGDKAIDRSPCGTGTSARMAQWFAKGQLNVGDAFVHESIIGSQFAGRVEAAVSVGPHRGIIPSIAGQAYITGHNNILLDDSDPYVNGFQVL